MLQDCTQPKNAFALTAKNYVFYRYCKRLQVRKLPKNTQFGILCVSPTFLYIAMQKRYVATTVYNKTNVQMRLITFPMHYRH